MNMTHEVTQVLQRAFGRHARRPATKIALWLAFIPLMLPAPLIAGIMAVSARWRGNSDPTWTLIMAISAANFMLSAVAIAWLSTLFGGWLVERLREFFDLFILWPITPSPAVRQVPV
jgi:polyferredoxin